MHHWDTFTWFELHVSPDSNDSDVLISSLLIKEKCFDVYHSHAFILFVFIWSVSFRCFHRIWFIKMFWSPDQIAHFDLFRKFPRLLKLILIFPMFLLPYLYHSDAFIRYMSFRCFHGICFTPILCFQPSVHVTSVNHALAIPL